MNRLTITAHFLQTITWFGDDIIDADSAWNRYSLDGKVTQMHKWSFGFNCNASIISKCGEYAFTYQKLGTKGLLLKNGELLREINRPYYYAHVHEYPAAFVTVNETTYLIHCPIKYCRLDFENVESGEIITDIPGRDPSDIFHSRLELSEDNTFFLVKGWWWHPLDVNHIYNVADCIKDPLLLDSSNVYPNVDVEVCTASIINGTNILIGSSDEFLNDENLETLPPKHIAIWDFATDEISKPVKVNGEFGNLFAIDENFAWDMYKYPKIINIRTGEIVDKDENIDSGKQNSAILHHADKFPQIAFNRQSKKMAIGFKDKIEVLEWNIQ